MPRQFTCGVLAVLVSLLSFAGIVQGTRTWWRGQGGSLTGMESLLAVRLVETGHAESASAHLRAAALPAPHHAAAMPTREPVQHFAPEPATGYVPVAELSERPILLQDLDPELELPTAAARTNGMDTPGMTDLSTDVTNESTATGILLINAQGGVDRLLFESPGYPRYLEVMLAQRFAEVRFLPGKIDGKPVPSALRITLQLQ